MFGEQKKLAENCIYLEGREPRSGLTEGDIAASLVYKKGGTVYVIDTGCGKRFRRVLVEAIESLRPFDGICVLNTHSHPDHTANNGIIREIDCPRKRHLISARGIGGLDYVRSFLRSSEALRPWCTIFDVIPFPWSVVFLPWIAWSRIYPKGREKFVAGVISKFRPLDPSAETAEPLESLPVDSDPRWSSFPERYRVDDAVVAIPTRGHSPDHVVFYIPEHRLLFSADETFAIYPLWPDSDSRATGTAIRAFQSLAKEGAIAFVADSHTPGVASGPAIDALLSRRLEVHGSFVSEFLLALEREGERPSIHRIYHSMVTRNRRRGAEISPQARGVSSVNDYFSMEFPRMPVYLKIVLATLLRENLKGRMQT